MDVSQLFSQTDFARIPLVPAPPGLHPNFDNPESHAWVGNTIIYITLAPMVFFIRVHVYTRARITFAFGADDILCLASTAAVIAEAGVALCLLTDPLGPHAWDVPLSKVTPELLELLLVQIVLYPTAALLLKASLLVFCLRIFHPKPVARIVICGSLVVIVIFYSIIIIYGPATCRPYDGSSKSPETFDPAQLPQEVNITEIIEQGGEDIMATVEQVVIPLILTLQQGNTGCAQNQGVVSAVTAVFSVVTDFYILALSIGLTLGLHLPTKQKIGVCVIFLVGLSVCVFSIVGAYYRFLSIHNLDSTWTSVVTLSLSIAEINVGLICSSVPVLPVAYKTLTGSRAWGSITSFIWSRRKGKGASEQSVSGGHAPSSRNRPNHWVSIPKGTLTGIRTVVWGSRQRGANQATEMMTYTEIESINDEYHAHIRKGSGANHSSDVRRGQPPVNGQRNTGIGD
ncbi:hypothetical protein F4778DRAFT_729157 [Xylariomycetidae sp. FL2044]|nr:hypothetical protein F4778DRAFT_729157 [Xylariomycetidae sp. FL2044]